MLFNSFEFIFLFVPTILIVCAFFGTIEKRNMTVLWLVAASFFFYGWWDIRYVAILIGSVAANYGLGILLVRGNLAHAVRKAVLVLGLIINLALLGWFKYSFFIVENFNAVTGSNLYFIKVALPLGISFFTFQQVAFLVDAYRNKVGELAFGSYSLFVTFFPQLIAGPIVHHAEMRRQYDMPGFGRLSVDRLTIGLTIFAAGLFKKVILADYTSIYANAVFEASLQGIILTPTEAWVGAFAYSLQLYFDFSGYSDMAIGIAWMFGIRLPLNFNSPYKAVNIIDFWRRWHMTLSRFLRDYLYFPLGGNRRGPTLRMVNLGLVMILGGVWHGAGWTFVAWGALHGVYLIINHAWQNLRVRLGIISNTSSHFARAISRMITLLSVVISWVLFRAENFESAQSILSSMAGLNGFFIPRWAQGLLTSSGVDLSNLNVVSNYFANDLFYYQDYIGPWLIAMLLIVLCMPNTQEIMGKHCPALDPNTHEHYSLSAKSIKLQLRLGARWGLIVGVAFAVSLLALGELNEFLYFQF